MADPRFFETRAPLSLAQIVALGGGELARGDPDALIHAVAPLSEADEGAIGFLNDRKHAAALRASRAGALIVPPASAADAPATAAVIVSSEPQALWARTAARLYRPIGFSGPGGVHPQAQLEDGVEIGPGAVVAAGTRIGRGTRIGPNAVIGPGVCIGRDGEIGPGSVVGFALIGDRVRLSAGVVIGEAGFGVAPSARGTVDVPQLGRVIIQDDVSIGANTCVDRGAFADTVIGEGARIDNLVQIAHNVRIGRNCLIAAHVGISGSTVVGDGVIFGGKAGVADHRRVGEGARVAAAASVLSDVPAGETWSGYPARPLRRFLRETAWVAKQARARTKGETDE